MIKLPTILLYVCYFLLSCKHEKSDRQADLEQEYKSIYKDQFKLTYFRKLLRVGFNNSEAINTLLEVDRNGFSETIITLNDIQLIDSLVHIDNLQMIADSLSGMGRIKVEVQGKHVFDYILKRFESNWLDSLVRERLTHANIDFIH